MKLGEVEFGRREALRRVAAGLLGGGWALAGCGGLQKGAEEGAASRLEREWARLAGRNYAEEGIEVFLAGESWPGSGRERRGSAEGQRLAGELRALAEAYERWKPGATGEDLPKVVEVLAARDFGGGKGGGFSRGGTELEAGGGGLGRAAADWGAKLAGGPVIRAVNFHHTPRRRAGWYREQLRRLAERFAPVTEGDLEGYLATGRWEKAKPGVIIGLYEGYRNGYDVMRPMLEEFGLVGWFFVITGFVKAAAGEQLAFAGAHDIGLEGREYEDGRHALSWGELRELERGHVVASHGRSHVWLEGLEDGAREGEVIGSQRDFEENLGHGVRTFVSYGGPAHGVYAKTDALVERAGHGLVFSNLQVQRLAT